MTNPFFLEVIINPDLLPFEQPFVLAHEWAHLAGYADESEANFVAWLTCVQGDAAGPLQRVAGAVRTWSLTPCHATIAVRSPRRWRQPAADLPRLDSG